MKTVILTPCFGKEDPEHRDLMEVLEKRHQIIRVRQGPYIDMNRAFLATVALRDTTSDVFFFIDQDVIFVPDDVDMMSELLLSKEELKALYSENWKELPEKLGILAGAYPVKRQGGFLAGRLSSSVKSTTFFENGRIEPLDFVHMGFTAIRREVFEDLARNLPEVYCGMYTKPVYPFFHHIVNVEKKAYWGEDVAFCERAKELGYSLGLDTRMRVGHKGEYVYYMEDIGMVVPRVRSLIAHADAPDVQDTPYRASKGMLYREPSSPESHEPIQPGG